MWSTDHCILDETKDEVGEVGDGREVQENCGLGYSLGEDSEISACHVQRP